MVCCRLNRVNIKRVYVHTLVELFREFKWLRCDGVVSVLNRYGGVEHWFQLKIRIRAVGIERATLYRRHS